MFTTIPVWEVDQYIENNENVMIIDLRSPFSYQRGHLKDAVNLPYEQYDIWKKQLPREKRLIFYCSRGGQSMMVCRHLEAMGYHVINLANGIAYYKGKYMVRG